jgi:hypothetical protein
MKSNKKLKLNELKVNSFVTNETELKLNTLKGGTGSLLANAATTKTNDSLFLSDTCSIVVNTTLKTGTVNTVTYNTATVNTATTVVVQSCFCKPDTFVCY